ncbi:hypothetical protein HWC53_gp103 [Bacillus phage vB_BmeM-Goe8]|uniref:Uncharacterized protein n=1 Tax=Bacillus phage vB_BmeM-Goe8 TaxID=2593638 RepID=A0A516KN30_9CAUD|nr:hypothetical protein HWC53_gp103 [Bacillus phage vB_BmeM-Goe8]QDP42986.1 hypothetical protein Goe8_c02130 [Bacillus phage vB_BmeM-Goe8]
MQSAFIARQPNGLYCRFSHVVECPTHINMTEEDYLSNFTETVSSREEGENILAYEVRPFSEVERYTTTNHMTKAEFKRVKTHVTLPKSSIFVFKLAL